MPRTLWAALALAIAGTAWAESPRTTSTVHRPAHEAPPVAPGHASPAHASPAPASAPAHASAPASAHTSTAAHTLHRPAHASPPAHAAAPAHTAHRPAHASPPAHAATPAHASPPAHAATPAHASPPAHAATPAHAAPPAHASHHRPAHASSRPADRATHVARTRTLTRPAVRTPARPAPPPPEVAYYDHRYHRLRPYHGVFVYGPRPHYHYVYTDRTDFRANEKHVPDRKVDRDDSVAIGVKGGSIVGGYDTAAPFADPGIGGVVRWRPDEAVGLEGSVAGYGMQTEDSVRTNTTAQASVALFAAPWSRVSPYVLGGLTWDARGFDDVYLDRADGDIARNDLHDVQWGPHVGAGIELAVGKSVAIDLDARYTAFLTAGPDDPTLPGAVQTGAAVLLHF